MHTLNVDDLATSMPYPRLQSETKSITFLELGYHENFTKIILGMARVSHRKSFTHLSVKFRSKRLWWVILSAVHRNIIVINSIPYV